jgi:2-oxo-4-hydroxy-4-carboxy-5-ureidoimidazoline decarboxylase
MKLAEFNQLDIEARVQQLLACCHCVAWANRVAAAAPFDSVEELLEVTDAAWAEATEADILEAFSGHPEIGDLSALRNRFAKTASAEQGQVTQAPDEVLLKLKAGNEAYRDKFGFIFIVFAANKSAEEMLALLEQRSSNDRAQELMNGAREQGLITRLRLTQLIDELSD